MKSIVCFYNAEVPSVLLQMFMNPHSLFMFTIYLTNIVILLPNSVLFFLKYCYSCILCTYDIFSMSIHPGRGTSTSTLLKTVFLIQIKGLRIEGAVYWCFT